MRAYRRRYSSVVAVLLCLLLGFFLAKGTGVTAQQKVFEKNLQEMCTEYRLVSLRELASFKWDKVLLFPAYTSSDEIYAKVGYKWAHAPNISLREDQMGLVFLLEGKVVCSIFSPTFQYLLSSEAEELWAASDPQFAVVSRQDQGLQLSWYDPESFPSEALCGAPEMLVGEMLHAGRDGALETQGRLTTTAEGFICGFLTWRMYKDEESSELVGLGTIHFSGTFAQEGNMHCKVTKTSAVLQSGIARTEEAWTEQEVYLSLVEEQFRADFCIDVQLMRGDEVILETSCLFVGAR